ncbi:hypothetical protein HK101_011645 [Irineochytrium annulatum]|nr:hypothetical protein HK101_011645 [Irineochytrium annulatum]
MAAVVGSDAVAAAEGAPAAHVHGCGTSIKMLDKAEPGEAIGIGACDGGDATGPALGQAFTGGRGELRAAMEVDDDDSSTLGDLDAILKEVEADIEASQGSDAISGDDAAAMGSAAGNGGIGRGLALMDVALPAIEEAVDAAAVATRPEVSILSLGSSPQFVVPDPALAPSRIRKSRVDDDDDVENDSAETSHSAAFKRRRAAGAINDDDDDVPLARRKQLRQAVSNPHHSTPLSLPIPSTARVYNLCTPDTPPLPLQDPTRPPPVAVNADNPIVIDDDSPVSAVPVSRKGKEPATPCAGASSSSSAPVVRRTGSEIICLDSDDDEGGVIDLRPPRLRATVSEGARVRRRRTSTPPEEDRSGEGRVAQVRRQGIQRAASDPQGRASASPQVRRRRRPFNNPDVEPVPPTVEQLDAPLGPANSVDLTGVDDDDVVFIGEVQGRPRVPSGMDNLHQMANLFQRFGHMIPGFPMYNVAGNAYQPPRPKPPAPVYQPPPPDPEPEDPARLKCIICLCTPDSKTPLSATQCGHIFCEACLKSAMKVAKKCPTCRKGLTGKNAVHRLYVT